MNQYSCLCFISLLFIPCQVEREKYACGVRWLYELLYSLQFTVDRLTVVGTKMVNDVARCLPTCMQGTLPV